VADISGIVLQSFRDKSFGLPISEENVLNIPSSRSAYCVLQYFDAGVSPRGLNDIDEHTALLQATLNYPAGTGDTSAKAKAQEVIDSYSFNDRLSGTGYFANVQDKSQFVGVAEDGWYSIVVRITFLFYLDRT
jgi:hypothetical protein